MQDASYADSLKVLAKTGVVSSTDPSQPPQFTEAFLVRFQVTAGLMLAGRQRKNNVETVQEAILVALALHFGKLDWWLLTKEINPPATIAYGLMWRGWIGQNGAFSEPFWAMASSGRQ